jgi:hypothetical protein
MLVVVIALQALSLVAGIKQTTRLVVTGPGLASPIEIADPSTLAESNVFGGRFIGDAADAPSGDAWTRYVVVFDVQTANGIKRDAYTIVFARSRWTDEALIYLPGRGDETYRRNISTILRPGQDGQWHHATPAWATAIDARLP